MFPGGAVVGSLAPCHIKDPGNEITRRRPSWRPEYKPPPRCARRGVCLNGLDPGGVAFRAILQRTHSAKPTSAELWVRPDGGWPTRGYGAPCSERSTRPERCRRSPATTGAIGGTISGCSAPARHSRARSVSRCCAARDYAAVKRALAEAGYKGEKIVVIVPTNVSEIGNLNRTGAEQLRRAGINVDLQEMDFGSVVRRHSNQGPPDKGGYNMFCTLIDRFLPNVHPYGNLAIRADGKEPIIRRYPSAKNSCSGSRLILVKGEIGHRQQLGLAIGQPLGSGRALTLGTVAVATGIVGDADLAAALTLLDVAAQSGGAAGFDGSHDTPLVAAEMTGVSVAVSGTVVAEDVRHLECGAHAGRLIRRGQLEMQLVEGADGVGDDRGGDLQIHSGRCQLGVAEQQLNGADVGAGFEQMGGKAVAQGMQADRLVQTCRAPRRAQSMNSECPCAPAQAGVLGFSGSRPRAVGPSGAVPGIATPRNDC